MTRKARMELGQIKRASTITQKKLYSSDPVVAKKAEAQLDNVAKALRAWGKKYGVRLSRHVESHPRGGKAGTVYMAVSLQRSPSSLRGNSI